MNPTVPTPDQQPIGPLPEVPTLPETMPAPQPLPQAPAPSAPIAGTPLADMPVAPAPVVPAPVPYDPAVGTPIVGAPPAVADDIDVIEKEWVDASEAAVKRTADDPHAEEEAIEELQIDYLKKRYDHSVDKPAE